MAFKVEIKGLRELQAKIDNLPSHLVKEANGHLQRGAQVFVQGAKRDAAKNFAGGVGLAGGISYYPNPVTGLSVTMVSAAFYSPYVEWGTITHVSVPPDQQEYAIQFKGKGIRKTGGMFPRPFFFKQTPLAVTTIETGLQAMINDIKL